MVIRAVPLAFSFSRVYTPLQSPNSNTKYGRQKRWLFSSKANFIALKSRLFSCKVIFSPYTHQSNNLCRGPTELVHHFAYRGSSHRRWTLLDVNLVWLYRSPISVGRRVIFYSFKWFYLPSLLLGGGGGGSATWGSPVQYECSGCGKLEVFTFHLEKYSWGRKEIKKRKSENHG